jgi:hypothetical protein
MVTGSPLRRNLLRRQHYDSEEARRVHVTERYHQGIGSLIIKPQPSPSNDNASLDAIACRPRLGGLLNFNFATCVGTI